MRLLADGPLVLRSYGEFHTLRGVGLEEHFPWGTPVRNRGPARLPGYVKATVEQRTGTRPMAEAAMLLLRRVPRARL